MRKYYKALINTYEQQENYREALNIYKLYSEINDSLLAEENSKNIAELQTKYESDKKEKQIEIQQLKLDQQILQLNKNQILIYAFSLGFALVLFLAFVIYRGYRQKQTANELLSEQKAVIEEKNKDIIDSIQYAKRIQEAILPPDILVEEQLKDSFVFYKPKDIVSGDFYWVQPQNGKVLFAVVDCTGHGVPGAFMSIVGHNGLNHAVKELKLGTPSDILNSLNQTLADTIHLNDSATIRDGMDLALCCLDVKNMTLEYAGANNPLWLVRNNNGKPSLEEINADKNLMGLYVQPFTNHVIGLNKNDCIYLFSDGYPDQFGGLKGKKFKYVQFKELLLSLSTKPMKEQRDILNTTFNKWRGNLQQVDDICIMGVRV